MLVMLHVKLGLEQQWADLVYNGQWFSPLKQAFDAFFANTQQTVTGTVKVKLYKGSCTVVGRQSASSLYDLNLATYDNDDAFDQTDARGFISIQALSLKTWAMKQAELQLAAVAEAVSQALEPAYVSAQGTASAADAKLW